MAPLVLAPAEPSIRLSPHTTGVAGQKQCLRILVAEDDAVSRLHLVHALRRLGHDVLVASNGLDAWRLFTTHGADVVVTDWLMPGIDGPELCRRVRSGGETLIYTPFIFLTMLDDNQHALQAMEVGADDYLVKPLDVNALRARLVAVQRLKRLEDERRRLLEAERRARSEAEAAVRTRDELLAAVTHDLRTPLTVIHSSAQLLLRRLAILKVGSQVEPLVRDADRIAAGAVRMGKWIDDLVDIAHVGVGEPIILQQTTVDLVNLAHQAVVDHQSTTDRHQISLNTACTSLTGNWDESRLRRALDNLLSNAIKYSPNGGAITVTIDEIATAGVTTATLRVHDEGVGIPVSDLDIVFDRYTRAGNVGNIAGQGIGLAGVRQIVEQHGGTVSLQSGHGAGSEFTLRLPISGDEARTRTLIAETERV